MRPAFYSHCISLHDILKLAKGWPEQTFFRAARISLARDKEDAKWWR
jgi:hypothetical protein